MTDSAESTWFRRNLMGVIISALVVLLGAYHKLSQDTLKESIESLDQRVNKVVDDHEDRIRVLERGKGK